MIIGMAFLYDNFLRCIFCALLPHTPDCFQHRLSEDGIAPLRGIHQHVGDGTDQFTVLYDGTAAHECVKKDTTPFSRRILPENTHFDSQIRTN